MANGLFEVVDGEVLYSITPWFGTLNRRLLELAQGIRHCLSAEALLKNESESGEKSELIAVEPYSNEILNAGFPGITKRISSPVQDLEFSEFERLVPNDILFIDGSRSEDGR